MKTHTSRIRSLRALLGRHKIDALLITNPVNVFYLTALKDAHCALIIGPAAQHAVTDFISRQEVTTRLPGWTIHSSENGIPQALAEVTRRLKLTELAFEADAVSVHQAQAFARALKKSVRLSRTSGIVESLREIKDATELASIKKAVDAVRSAYDRLVSSRRSFSRTERDAALSFKKLLLESGADGWAFEPIIAAPPHSSRPHHIPSGKAIGKRGMLLIDVGASVGGYNSDLTRMRPLGTMSSKFTALYTIVRDAQRYALECIRPGIRACDIDAKARQHITSKGFGKFFGHGLGHGIGLDIHEHPVISPRNRHIMRRGCVFTVEPGIYIPGFGGVRIEDMVYVTTRGCKVLTYDIDKSV